MIRDRAGVIPLIVIMGILGIITLLIFVLFIQSIFIIGIISIAILILYLILKGKLQLKKGQGIIALVIVVILVVLALGGGLIFTTTLTPISTESVEMTQIKSGYCFNLRVEYQNGKNPTETLRDPNTQATMYATAIKQGIQSETITVTLYAKKYAGCPEKDFRFRFYKFADASLVSNPMNPQISSMEHITTTGKTHHELQSNWAIVTTTTYRIEEMYVGYTMVYAEWSSDKGYNWYSGSYDYAYLQSGGGGIKVDSDSDVFEFGDTVPFKISTGFSGNQHNNPAGWFIRIYDPKGILYHTIQDIPNFLYESTSYSFEIPESAPFYQNMKNTWKAELHNGLFGIASTTFFTVDDLTLIPTVPEIILDEFSYEVGDVAVLDLQSEPNEKTNIPIKEFVVWIWIGSPSTMPSDPNDANWIVREHSLFASGNQASYTFDCKRAGNMVVKAVAFDESYRPSGSSVKEVMVYEPDETPILADLGIDLDLIWIIIIIILVIVLIYFIFKKKRRR